MLKWYYKLKLKSKLIVSFAILTAITAAVSIIGIVGITNTSKDGMKMYKEATLPISYLGEIRNDFQLEYIACMQLIQGDSSQSYMVHKQELEKLGSDINENLTKLEAHFNSKEASKEAREIYDKFTRSRKESLACIEKLIELARDNGNDSKAQLLLDGNMNVSITKQEAALDDMVKLCVNYSQTTSENNVKNANRASILTIIMFILNIMVSVFTAWFLSYVIANPVKHMLMAAEKIADGDLNVEIKKIKNKDEIGKLADAFRHMADSLNDVVSGIRISSQQVASGSKQISASSQALSQGATEQASSVEELTASIEEIAAQTRQNSENIKSTADLSDKLKADAKLGNEHMELMLDSMSKINESSNHISKVIKVIDDIAFQTNILALNAAVEAAHAGQYGKGFAVVAEEVRNLAVKSANAAKETTSMIEGSIQKAESGRKVVGEAATSLQTMSDRISQIAVLGDQIATASDEQSSGIAQIDKAVQQVSQVIQTNSATSEEGAAASEELSGQAEILKDTINKFKLREDTPSDESDDNSDSENPSELTYKEVSDEEIPQTQEEEKISIQLGEEDFGKYAK